MNKQILGIHHITAIAGNPQTNLDFYAGLLGLRLVKLTVNFDDPTTYHLYYGDGAGHPGTILTFFPWPSAPKGRRGAGQVTETAFAIPADSVDFWTARLTAHAVPFEGPFERFGEKVVAFSDPDDMRVELIATASADRTGLPGWSRTFTIRYSRISQRDALRGESPAHIHSPDRYHGLQAGRPGRQPVPLCGRFR